MSEVKETFDILISFKNTEDAKAFFYEWEKQFDLTDKILKHIQKEKETVKPARTDEYDWSSITLGLDSEE